MMVILCDISAQIRDFSKACYLFLFFKVLFLLWCECMWYGVVYVCAYHNYVYKLEKFQKSSLSILCSGDKTWVSWFIRQVVLTAQPFPGP